MADLSLFVSLLFHVTCFDFRKFTVVEFGAIFFLLACGHDMMAVWLFCVDILRLKTWDRFRQNKWIACDST